MINVNVSNSIRIYPMQLSDGILNCLLRGEMFQVMILGKIGKGSWCSIYHIIRALTKAACLQEDIQEYKFTKEAQISYILFNLFFNRLT